MSKQEWKKKLFRLSECDIKRLDAIVSEMTPRAKDQNINVNMNRTIVLRAIIMLVIENESNDKLVEYLKLAHVHV